MGNSQRTGERGTRVRAGRWAWVVAVGRDSWAEAGCLWVGSFIWAKFELRNLLDVYTYSLYSMYICIMDVYTYSLSKIVGYSWEYPGIQLPPPMHGRDHEYPKLPLPPPRHSGPSAPFQSARRARAAMVAASPAGDSCGSSGAGAGTLIIWCGGGASHQTRGAVVEALGFMVCHAHLTSRLL